MGLLRLLLLLWVVCGVVGVGVFVFVGLFVGSWLLLFDVAFVWCVAMMQMMMSAMATIVIAAILCILFFIVCT